MVAGRPFATLIVGPTAVGKSALALEVAETLGGEIVSLDSRQMVRGLDIGTAKPTAEERRRVRHHLVDITEPDAPLALPDVLDRIAVAVADIIARGGLPVLVGGTGQYVRALREGWRVPPVAPDPVLRGELAALAEAFGAAALHARLAALDAGAAARIDPRNVRRVIRAIEVATAGAGTGGEAMPPRSGGPWLDLLVVGLTRPRPLLYARIDARIEAMLAAGLEAEVRQLVARGFGWHLPAMSSVGYGEWRGYLEGRIDAPEVHRLIRHNTRRLVRNQSAWFGQGDPEIHWFDLSDPSNRTGAAAVLAGVSAWVAERGAGRSDDAERAAAATSQYNGPT